MLRGTFQLGTLLLSAVLSAGCGFSQNPSYFPHLLPAGDIVRTHGKPSGPGYYANFDPYACRLEVRPLESSNPVRTQHVLIATVYDNDNQPRRARRVEWMLEGVGHIVEVDESGLHPGRGYKVDNRYAVSYTDYKEHLITRGNNDPNDDFVIRPGQTWCVITSPVEGDTHVTIYAPEIHNWDKHKATAIKHWINAAWTIPPPAVNRVGTNHVFTTNIYRHTDRMPLANYRVRYTVLDGPPAVFIPTQQPVAEAISDLQGNASITLAQVQPQPGVNRIGVEIIRPPDPCCPTGPGIIIGRGETFKEWQAPAIAVSKVGPPNVAVGQPFTYTITVTNVGRIEVDAVTVRDVVPDGLSYQNSQPPANVEGRDVIWTLGPIAPGQSSAIQATFRGERVGSFTNVVTATTPEGIRAENSFVTQVTAPQLAVSKDGPETAIVGTPINYQITITNPGTGPATNITLIDEFDDGLEHQSGSNPVQLDVGVLQPGQSRTIPLVLTARRPGRFVNRVVASGDGGLTARAEHVVTAAQPRLSITKVGPRVRYARRPAEWNITVANTGQVAASNVVLRDLLPPELVFQSATEGGQLVGGQVVWNLGTLQPGESRTMQLTTRAEQLADRALNVAVVTGDGVPEQRAEAAIQILGVPAFLMEAMDVQDPVEVGGRTTYEIRISNTGTLVGNGIQITAIVPPQMKALSGAGPVQPRIEGNRVIFPAVDGLQPGRDLLYTVTVETLQAGDVRFRVELKSTSLGPDPVIEEEPTNIYRPTIER